ncbi:MAG: hypothetical protein PHN92_06520 [Geobacter sp.]|nr:hypothetical protein [Geobacter sp.]
MCRHYDDPSCCDFCDECDRDQNGICTIDQIDEEIEHQRQAVESARRRTASEPTLIGTIMENAAPPDLILSKFKKMLAESGAAVRIIRGEDDCCYALLGPFDAADNYILSALSGGAS